jgi:hypothetical protein
MDVNGFHSLSLVGHSPSSGIHGMTEFGAHGVEPSGDSYTGVL